MNIDELAGEALAEAVAKNFGSRHDVSLVPIHPIDWTTAGLLLDEIRRRGWPVDIAISAVNEKVWSGVEYLKLTVEGPDLPNSVARLFLKIAEREKTKVSGSSAPITES